MKKLFLFAVITVVSINVLYCQQSKEEALADMINNMSANQNIVFDNLNPSLVSNYLSEVNANPNNLFQINVVYLGEPAATQYQTNLNNLIAAANILKTFEVDYNYIKSHFDNGDPTSLDEETRCKIDCYAIAGLAAIGCAFTPPPADVACIILVAAQMTSCTKGCGAFRPYPPGGGYPKGVPNSWRAN